MSRLSWPSVLAAARAVVDRYETPLTLRQLYYVLGAEQVIPLTEPTYKRLSARLAEARRSGRFPALIDHGRTLYVRRTYADPGELLAAVPQMYRADLTAGQSIALYVGVEKDTLQVQLAGWLDRYGVPVLVTRGYGSQSYAERVRAHVTADERPAVLLYVGDLDASGEDIERDWVARTGCWTDVRRLAVTAEQAAQLTPAAGKATDSRWPAFARRHDLDPARPVQYEVEAIEPAELRRLIVTAVDGYVDAAALEHAHRREEAGRRHLEAFLRTWPAPDDTSDR